jgi:hypothetical protein
MRELTIKKIQRRIQTISESLVKKYDTRLLKTWEFLQKEIQIQKMYQNHEGKDD